MRRDIANDLRDDLCFIAVRGIDNAVGAEDRPQVQFYGAGAELRVGVVVLHIQELF